MTKQEIVRRVSDELGITKVQAGTVVQMILDVIIETLVTEGRIELRNFGVFEVRRRRPRTARNPHTGEKVAVPERLVVRFTPGEVMKRKVSEALAWKVGATEPKESLQRVGTPDAS